MKHRLLLLLASVLLSAAGCGDGDGITFPGSYSLFEMEYHTLPALLHTIPGTPPTELFVTDGSIRVDEEGEFFVAFHFDRRQEGTITSQDRWSDYGTYARVSRALAFSSSRYPGLKYGGVLHSGGLRLEHDLSPLLGTDTLKRFQYQD